MKEEDIDSRIERVVRSVAAKRAAMRGWEAHGLGSEIDRRAVCAAPAVAAASAGPMPSARSASPAPAAAKPPRKWRLWVVSAAASVIVILGVGISLYIGRSGGDDVMPSAAPPAVYRGGSADIQDIQAMIDCGRYDEALQAIEVTRADTAINPSFTPERQEYLRSLNANRDYELEWLRIGVLVKCGRKEAAVAGLREYVKTDGEHRHEAETLLNELTK